MEPITSRTETAGAGAGAWGQEGWLGALAKLVNQGIFLADATGAMRYTSPRAQALGGFGEEEARGEGWLRLIHNEDRLRASASWRAAVAGGRAWKEELRWARAPEQAWWRAEPFRGQGQIQGWVGTIKGGGEREPAAELLAALVEHSGDAIEMATLDGNVIFLNRAGLELVGWNTVLPGATLGDFLPPERREAYLAEIRSRQLQGEGWEGEVEFQNRKTGELVPTHTKAFGIRDRQGRLVARALIARDIRERRRAEAQLLQTEKLAAMGRVAATVAHEINNPLGTAINMAYVLRREPGLSEQARRRAEQLADELARVAAVATQTLSFYREAPVTTSVRVAELLDRVLHSFVHRISTDGVQLSTMLDTQAEVQASANELQQVFINLIGNALDAMLEGGELCVRLYASRSWAGAGREGRPGVRITIADRGPGILESDRQRLFEPFVTTKTGTGVGLGLWVSREIVKKHQGTIQVRNRRGGGACVHLFLPSEQAA